MKALVLSVILIALVISGLILTRPAVQAELQPVPPTRVQVTQTRSQRVEPLTRITGRLQPSRSARLQFEVAGRLLSRLVEPGMTVSEGEVLLTVDAADLQDAVSNASATLEQEKAAVRRDQELLKLSGEEITLLRKELMRLEKLGRDALASQSRSDEVRRQLLNLQASESNLRYSVNTASARLSRARTTLALAQRNLERAQLRAPFDATINRVHVELGDYVMPGQVALDLVKIDVLDLALEAPESVISGLRMGQQISLETGEVTRVGKLVALAVDPDPQTLTYAMRVRIPAQDAVAGQLAEALLPGMPNDAAILVPRTAILREEGGTYLFLIKGETLQRQAVDIVMAYREDFVIRGVAAGVTIVARDVAALADGQQVVIP